MANTNPQDEVKQIKDSLLGTADKLNEVLRILTNTKNPETIALAKQIGEAIQNKLIPLMQMNSELRKTPAQKAVDEVKTQIKTGPHR